MKTIRLYEYGKSTRNGWESWWSADKPENVLGFDFIEHTDTADFEIPAPWTRIYIDGENGNTLYYSAEFRTDSGVDGHLETNAEGVPVIVDDATGKHYKMIRVEEETS